MENENGTCIPFDLYSLAVFFANKIAKFILHYETQASFELFKHEIRSRE